MSFFEKVFYDYEAPSFAVIVTIKVEKVVADHDTFLNEFSTASGPL